MAETVRILSASLISSRSSPLRGRSFRAIMIALMRWGWVRGGDCCVGGVGVLDGAFDGPDSTVLFGF